jgi:hypothetical protein
MGTVTIQIEDNPDGTVSARPTPKLSYLLQKAKAGELTSAEGYAVFALNKIKEESKAQGSTIIKLPRFRA